MATAISMSVVLNCAGVRCYENLDGRGDFRVSEAAMTDWDYNSFFRRSRRRRRRRGSRSFAGSFH